MKSKLQILKNSLMLFFFLFTTILAFSKTTSDSIPLTSSVPLHKTNAFSTITSAQTGDWSSTSTWADGVVPTFSDNVVIASGHTVTLNDDAYATRNSGTTTVVNVGGILATGKTYKNYGTTTINGSFQLDPGGWSDSSGTNNLVYGSNGTLIFNVTYGANSGNYWPTTNGPVNVTVNSGCPLDLGFSRTVNGLFQTASNINNPGNITIGTNGTLQLNSGYVWSGTGSPVYGSSSLLKYNSTGTSNRKVEWNQSSGTIGTTAGYPNNVQISTGAILNFANGTNATYKAHGNLTIDPGAEFYLNYAGFNSDLIIGGNLALNGNLGLGGDLYLGGDFVQAASAVFSANGKAVFFNGTATQTITKLGGGTIGFDYLVVNKAAGNVQLSSSPATSVSINSNSGDVLQLLGGGNLDLNGQTLDLSGTGGNVKLIGSQSMNSTLSNATFKISGGYGSIKYIYGGTLSIAANVITVLQSGLNFGSNVTTILGKLKMQNNGFVPTDAPIYGSSSTLEYNGINPGYNVGNEWNGNAATAALGIPKDVNLISSTVNFPNFNHGLAGNLNIDTNSTLNLNGSLGDLYIAGNWTRTGSGTFNPNNRAVFFNGTTAQTITGATTFDYLTINNTTGVTLASSIINNLTLNFIAGKLTLGANNLTIGSGGTITNFTSAKYVMTNSTGQLKRTVAASDVLFPVGNSAYNPITFNNTGGTSDVYGVRVEDGPLTTALYNLKTVKRKWWLSENVAGGSNLKVIAQYNTGEPDTGFNAASNPKIGYYNGSCWTAVSAAVTGTTFTSTANTSPASLTGTQYFALGNDDAFFAAALSISTHPLTPTGYVCEDGSVTFTVVATGSAILNYEWRKNGTAIPGAGNSATYTIAHTTLSDAGNYSVLVYDNCSRTITSNAATLTIDPIPTMAKPVASTICGSGGKSFVIFSGLIPGITGRFLYYVGADPLTNYLSEIGTADANGEYRFETTNLPAYYRGVQITIKEGINTVSGCRKTFLTNNSFIITVGQVSTWSGSSWTNGVPSEINAAVFDANYSPAVATDITTCSLEVKDNKTVTIKSGSTVNVIGEIKVAPTGSLTLENNVNLIQTRKDVVNTGNINVKNSVVNLRYNPGVYVDYVYWSSPVAGQITKGNATGAFSPGTPPNRFYTYRESNDRFYETGDPTFVPGKGYAVQAETNIGTAPFTAPYTKDYKFTGIPNNGDISYNITKVGGGYNLVGNPYPSNINFDELYQGNSTIIENTAWFWTNNVFAASQQGSSYGGNNYAVWNGSGGVPATSTPSGSPTPTGIIKVGQGFIVQKKNTGTSALQFKNSYSSGHDLRVSSTAPFFQKGVSEKNRFTLKLLSPSQLFNSQLIAYVAGATNDYEQDYDAEAFDNYSDLFYSILPGKKLVIQGKDAAFTIEDKVALGANFFQTGSYTISLDNIEGIFNGTQNVYLKDKQEGIITNLSQASYTFNAAKGDNSGRFEIIYKPETVLATAGAGRENIVVYKDGNNFVVQAQSKRITNVEVYDSSGRLMLQLNPNNVKAVVPTEKMTNGVYILKINQNGEVTTKKVIR